MVLINLYYILCLSLRCAERETGLPGFIEAKGYASGGEVTTAL